MPYTLNWSRKNSFPQFYLIIFKKKKIFRLPNPMLLFLRFVSGDVSVFSSRCSILPKKKLYFIKQLTIKSMKTTYFLKNLALIYYCIIFIELNSKQSISAFQANKMTNIIRKNKISILSIQKRYSINKFRLCHLNCCQWQCVV